MLAVVSPYHLTSREPAACVALLLARHAVTLLPGAGDQGRSASSHHTRYAEFIESWRWSVPLWEAGVLASAFEEDDPNADVDDARCDLERSPELAGLRRVMGLAERTPDDREDDDEQAGWDDRSPTLDAVARDLLRAGPDPAISLPVAAGLDRFATRHDLIAVRAESRSLAQKTEDRFGERCFRVAVPALLQADADRILDARDELGGTLDVLRDVVERAFAGECDEDDVRDAAATYEDAFDAVRDDLARVVDPDDPRVLTPMVALTGSILPEDAVFRSCAQTAASVGGRARRAAAHARQIAASPATLAGGRVATLSVRVIGRNA